MHTNTDPKKWLAILLLGVVALGVTSLPYLLTLMPTGGMPMIRTPEIWKTIILGMVILGSISFFGLFLAWKFPRQAAIPVGLLGLLCLLAVGTAPCAVPLLLAAVFLFLTKTRP